MNYVQGKNKFKYVVSAWWMPFGLLILFIGMFIFPSRGGYKTIIYLTFILPSLIFLLMDFKNSFENYFSGTVLLAITAILYLAASNQWSPEPDVVKKIKYALIIFISGYGLYCLTSNHYRLFSCISIFSVILVGLFSIIWILDFYIGNNYPLSRRFLTGATNHFGIYEPGSYANFRNPLLLSHPLTFFFTLGLYFFRSSKKMALQITLLLSLASIFTLIILAQTQMAWILAAIILIFHSIVKFHQKSFWPIVVICMILAFSIWYLHYSELKNGLSYRFDIWIKSFYLILEKPWLGHGLGGYPLVAIENGMAWGDVHNIYIALLYHSGLFGLLLFALTGLSMIRTALRNKNVDHTWFLQWFIFLFFVQMTDGGGLLSRPSERWFSLWIPAMFLLAQTRIWELKSTEAPHANSEKY